jgi:glycerophosphoryl diester phosphodiesterase
MKKYLISIIISLFFSINLSAQITHSHNDYEQKQPFFAAYNLGFDSIEADLYLKDGELYVAHDWKNITPDRTLKSLYIDPLLARIKENNGFPYPNKKPLQILLDLKREGKEILVVLYAQLKPYKKELRHVKIVISGDMPMPSAFQNYDKIFFFDGRKNLTYSKKAYKKVALMSASFLDFGKYWAGKEPLSDETFQKINTFVEEIHAKGKKVRIWGTPNTVLGFETLQKLKIDIIGTDDLELLAKFKQ